MDIESINKGKKWYEISEDELTARMKLKQKEKDEPLQRAVELLDVAIEKVLITMGVRPDLGDIPAQQEMLGITIVEEYREEMAGLQGFFVFDSKMEPYAWIGEAKVDGNGEVTIEIHWFKRETMDSIGGLQLRRAE